MVKAKRVAPSKWATKRFPAKVIATLDAARFVWIRAGSTHRFTGIWVVVEDGRVFVRSWYMKPSGWFHAFRATPRGAIKLGDREIRVRAVSVRSAKVKNAVDKAYAAKYTTPASIQYVRGFARGRRKETTTELIPASA